jgi:hypothetical protein
LMRYLAKLEGNVASELRLNTTNDFGTAQNKAGTHSWLEVVVVAALIMFISRTLKSGRCSAVHFCRLLLWMQGNLVDCVPPCKESPVLHLRSRAQLWEGPYSPLPRQGQRTGLAPWPSEISRYGTSDVHRECSTDKELEGPLLTTNYERQNSLTRKQLRPRRLGNTKVCHPHLECGQCLKLTS